MNILHICIYFRNPMFLGMMDSLRKQSVTQRVLYYETRKIGLKKIDLPYVDLMPSNIRLLPSPYLRFMRLRIVADKMLNLYKENHSFNCIHAHTLTEDGYLALKAKKTWGIPYVVTVRSSDFNFKPFWKWKLYKKTVIEIIENAENIIFLSKSSQDEFYKTLGNESRAKLPPMRIIPNGIDKFWHENRWLRENDNRTLNDKWRVLTVGKIYKRKNQEITAEAVRQLREEGYDIEYELIGTTIDTQMKQKIQDLGFVQIKDFMDKTELIKEYRNNDIFLLASTNETFGLVYAEAMTQGLPVIYTKGQGFDGQFQNGQVGYSVRSDSVEDIKDAILSVIRRYNSLAKACYDNSNIFDWDIVAKELSEIYSTAGLPQKKE